MRVVVVGSGGQESAETNVTFSYDPPSVLSVARAAAGDALIAGADAAGDDAAAAAVSLPLPPSGAAAAAARAKRRRGMRGATKPGGATAAAVGPARHRAQEAMPERIAFQRSGGLGGRAGRDDEPGKRRAFRDELFCFGGVS